MKGKSVFFVGLLILLTLAIYSPNLTEAAIAPGAIPIQGKLTDPSGIPLNGTYSVIFSLYNVEAGGVALCSDTRLVSVVGGLFSEYMDHCYNNLNGERVYLGIKVEADDEMLPRQVIMSVPYALNLRPAYTYIFVPGHAMVKEFAADTTLWDMDRGGWAKVTYPGAPGLKNIFFPITVPGWLHGQNQRIDLITVYYKCTSANNFITTTVLAKQLNADTYVELVNDTIDRKSIVATAYSLTVPGPNNVLTSAQGILGLFLTLDFANAADQIFISGVRIRLIDDY